MSEVFQVAFVRSAPGLLAPGVLYVSMEHAAVLHLCACGCGHQVVLELSPMRYTLTYDGQGLTLDPSVGNWSFPCRSHYLIRASRVVWAAQWSDAQVALGRAQEAKRLVVTYGKCAEAADRPSNERRQHWWERLLQGRRRRSH